MCLPTLVTSLNQTPRVEEPITDHLRDDMSNMEKCPGRANLMGSKESTTCS